MSLTISERNKHFLLDDDVMDTLCTQPRMSLTVPVSTYVDRRLALARALPDQSVALVHSGCVKKRNHDACYTFRVESHFWYLTGFDEPNAVLVITKKAKEVVCTLFVAPKDPEKERWEGVRLGVEKAKMLGVTHTISNRCFSRTLPDLLQGMQSVWTPFSQKILTKKMQVLMNENIRHSQFPPTWNDLAQPIGRMRWQKSAQEIAIMRHGATINSLACIAAMRHCHPGCYEYQLAAAHQHESMQHGALALAYPSIVAGGANACILHYTSNAQQLCDGDFVLMDAGCEYNYYASDITRTFPVNGSFSSIQYDLYTLVLESQHHAIQQCVVGATLDDVHQAAVRTLTQGLIDIGILQGSLNQCLEHNSIKEYFMHGTSHWLGLDVHDNSPYSTTTIDPNTGKHTPYVLENNVVLTVEPGLYFDSPQAPDFVRGIGIRIEDDVLVHEQTPEILTVSMPKLPDDLCEIIGCDSGIRLR